MVPVYTFKRGKTMIDNMSYTFKVSRSYSKDCNTYEEAEQHFIDDLEDGDFTKDDVEEDLN